MQLVDHVVFPPSLQMEMENRPKFALTRLMTVPSSHSISRVDPSHPYLVRRSEPAMTSELILDSRLKMFEVFFLVIVGFWPHTRIFI